MSPKKKPAPISKSATKDDLINSLFESESASLDAQKESQKNRPENKTETKSETISRLSNVQAGTRPDARRASQQSPPRPPPPPPQGKDDNDRIYNFDHDSTQGLPPQSEDSVSVYDASKDTQSIDRNRIDSTRTLSIVRNPKPESAPLELEEVKTVVAPATNDESTRSKLKEVLRRLTPQISGHDKVSAQDKAKTPLYNSETAVAAVDAAKIANAKVLESVAPPPVKPVGVVAKAIYSGTNSSADERAPTEPVRSSIDPNEDEATVAQPQQPARSSSPLSRPMWQDAKTEALTRPMLDGPEADPEAEQFMPTEIRPNSPGARFREEVRQAQPGAAIFSSAEAALRQSENLRVAQKRISDLENELERVRRENESLRSAGDTLRRRMDELQAQAENAELNTQEAKKIAEEERKVLKGQIQSRDREISEMKGRIDDAETRLEANFRKIRVRERDLEHRIEIIKAESQSITASKDRMILELKRQIDQISSELNHAKIQVQETFGQFKEKQETARRAVRALRIALTVLEGEEDSGSRKE